MRQIFLFLFSVLFIGCSMQHPRPDQLSKREQIANKITIEVAKQLKKERNLIICGIGGQIRDGVKMLALSFHYLKPIEIEEGRELLIASVDKFTAAVNASEEIRPYLKNYPFQPQNIEIRIFIYKPDYQKVGNRELSVIYAIDGILKYDITSPVTDLFVTIDSETYEEAKQKINVEQIAI